VTHLERAEAERTPSLSPERQQNTGLPAVDWTLVRNDLPETVPTSPQPES